MRVYQGLPGQNLTVSVQDAFPSGLAFTREEHPDWMDFSNLGNALNWQANQGLATGETAMLLMEGRGHCERDDDQNTGAVNTGTQEFKLGAITTRRSSSL